MILVGEIDFDGHRAGGAIQCLHDTGDRALEHRVWIGFGANIRALPDFYQRHVFLHDLDESADGFDVMKAKMPRDMVEVLAVAPLT